MYARVCWCRRIFTYIHVHIHIYLLCVGQSINQSKSINQSIKSSQSRTRAQSHTRARRSPSQRHLKGGKPRVAKRRRLGGLNAPTLTEARVEANGEYRVKLARDHLGFVIKQNPQSATRAQEKPHPSANTRAANPATRRLLLFIQLLEVRGTRGREACRPAKV